MGRRKTQQEHENHERWLVSYADFITLLFAFFVVMYSISSVNEGKYKVLSKTLVAAFTGQPTRPLPLEAADLRDPLRILVGNEGHGWREAELPEGVRFLAIPTQGVESLNAAVAAGIACFEAARRGAP